LQSSLGLGLSYFIRDNIVIGTLLAYNRINGDSALNGVSLGIGFQIFLSNQEE